MTETLETEKAGNGLHIVAADNDCRLGLSVRIDGVQNAAVFFGGGGPKRATTAFQVASKHTASLIWIGKKR